MRAGSKPAAKGWYFDPYAHEWVEITPEEYEEARSYVDRGFAQTSAKYRAVGLYDRTRRTWVALERAELSPGVFAAFRELRETDCELQVYREREARRPRAKRLLAILRLLPDDRAEEFMLDITGGLSNLHRVRLCARARA